MASTLGSLVLSIETNLAQFTGDMGRMAAIASSNMAKIERAATSVKKGIDGIIGALAIGSMVHYADALIEAEANLDILSKRTGASVEALSAMSVVAKTTGTDIEQVAASFDKMQKNAYLAQSGTGQIAAAFRALGLGGKELAAGLKDPDKFFITIAQHLAQFKDDGNKTAVMLQVLGKGGDQLAAFMAQLATEEYGAAYASTEQAEKAHELEAGLTRLGFQLRALATDDLLAWLPAMDKLLAGVLLTGVNIQAAWHGMGIRMKYDFLIVLDSGIESLEWFAHKAQNIFRTMTLRPEIKFDDFAGMDAHIKARNEQLDELNRIKDEAAKAYVEATQQQVKLAATGPKDPRPSLGDAGVDRSAAMRRQINEQIKALNDGARAIEQAYKLQDQILDREYAQGAFDLAQYGDTKVALMESSFAATQAVYDQEISALEKYIKTVGDAEKIAEAQGKLEAAQAAKAANMTAHDAARENVSQTLIASSRAYADALTNIDEQYLAVIGDTQALTELQLEQQNGQLRGVLTAQKQWTALEKLKLVEDELILRSKKDPLSGFKVGVLDWVKQASNLAAKTQGMVTNFLDGMTNALVEFVQTGKLNFKDLINSMIADLARLVIEQQIAGWAASIGGWLGGGGGGLSEFSSSEINNMGGGLAHFASGGSFSVGGSGSGDNTPVAFMATPGEVVSVSPRGGGAGGGMGIHYAPVINIDSRSDRAQVQADTARIVRQGNKELLGMLQRYNPYLKA